MTGMTGRPWRNSADAAAAAPMIPLGARVFPDDLNDARDSDGDEAVGNRATYPVSISRQWRTLQVSVTTVLRQAEFPVTSDRTAPHLVAGSRGAHAATSPV